MAIENLKMHSMLAPLIFNFYSQQKTGWYRVLLRPVLLLPLLASTKLIRWPSDWHSVAIARSHLKLLAIVRSALRRCSFVTSP
jgi:hypothetical protein